MNVYPDPAEAKIPAAIEGEWCCGEIGALIVTAKALPVNATAEDIRLRL